MRKMHQARDVVVDAAHAWIETGISLGASGCYEANAADVAHELTAGSQEAINRENSNKGYDELNVVHNPYSPAPDKIRMISSFEFV